MDKKTMNNRLAIYYQGNPEGLEGVLNAVDKTGDELIARISSLEAENKELREAARFLLNNLPESEIDLAREVWGNTHANVVLNFRNELAALLKAKP